MDRRSLIKRAAAAAVMPVLPGLVGSAASSPTGPFRRLRPSDPDWPNAASWAKLNGEVRGRLIKVASPFEICRARATGFRVQRIVPRAQKPLFHRRPSQPYPDHRLGRRLDLATERLCRSCRNHAGRRRRGQLCPRQETAARRQGRRPLVSGHLERPRLTVDLDAADGCDDPARRFCRRGMRGPRGAAAGRHSRRRSDLGSHVQQGDD